MKIEDDKLSASRFIGRLLLIAVLSYIIYLVGDIFEV